MLSISAFLAALVGLGLLAGITQLVWKRRLSLVLPLVLLVVCFSFTEKKCRRSFVSAPSSLSVVQLPPAKEDTLVSIDLQETAPVAKVKSLPKAQVLVMKKPSEPMVLMPVVAALLAGLLGIGLLHGFSKLARERRISLVLPLALCVLLFSFAEKKIERQPAASRLSTAAATPPAIPPAPFSPYKEQEMIAVEVEKPSIQQEPVRAPSAIAQLSPVLSEPKPSSALASGYTAITPAPGMASVPPVAIAGLGESLPRFAVSLDVLCWEAFEDSLRYAEKNASTLSPGKAVEQNFGYDPGFKLGVQLPMQNDGWNVDLSWTYFHTTPPQTHVVDPDGTLFPCLTDANFFTPANRQVSVVKGSWSLNMDVLDCTFRRPLVIGSSTVINPIFGVKGCFVRQEVSVNYDYFTINIPNISTPRSMLGMNRSWGVGPQIGAEIKMLLPKEINFVMSGIFSGMFGSFDLSTKYFDLISTCGAQSGSFLLKDRISRIFGVSQLQGAFAKRWVLQKGGFCEVTAGWECQIWSRQMRLDWFSTIAYPPAGSDLFLQGPFLRFCLTY